MSEINIRIFEHDGEVKLTLEQDPPGLLTSAESREQITADADAMDAGEDRPLTVQIVGATIMGAVFEMLNLEVV